MGTSAAEAHALSCTPSPSEWPPPTSGHAALPPLDTAWQDGRSAEAPHLRQTAIQKSGFTGLNCAVRAIFADELPYHGLLTSETYRAPTIYNDFRLREQSVDRQGWHRAMHPNAEHGGRHALLPAPCKS